MCIDVFSQVLGYNVAKVKLNANLNKNIIKTHLEIVERI